MLGWKSTSSGATTITACGMSAKCCWRALMIRKGMGRSIAIFTIHTTNHEKPPPFPFPRERPWWLRTDRRRPDRTDALGPAHHPAGPRHGEHEPLGRAEQGLLAALRCVQRGTQEGMGRAYRDHQGLRRQGEHHGRGHSDEPAEPRAGQ